MMNNILKTNYNEIELHIVNMFRHQGKIDDLVTKHGIINENVNMTAFMYKTFLALQSELGEFIDETQYKWWKQSNDINIDNLLTEYVDGILILESTLHYLVAKLLDDEIYTHHYLLSLFKRIVDELPSKNQITLNDHNINQLNLSSLLQVFAIQYTTSMNKYMCKCMPYTKLVTDLQSIEQSSFEHIDLIKYTENTENIETLKAYFIVLSALYFTAIDNGFLLLELLNIKTKTEYKWVDLFRLMHKKIDINIERQQGKVQDRLDYVPSK